MAKIWKESANIDEHPNRNNFDLRYQNHLTMKMGGIYPIMAKECVPGDSFTIDTAFGLKFMPLVFPVQSHMRSHISYFYVPNRIIWDNWKNFISGLEEHEHPYISQPKSWFKTGSLCDYLDVPTTIVDSTSRVTTKVSSGNVFNGDLVVGRGRGEGNRPISSSRQTADPTVGYVNTDYMLSAPIKRSFVESLVSNQASFTASQAVNLDTDTSSNYHLYFYNSPLNLLSSTSTFAFEGYNLSFSNPRIVFWKIPAGDIVSDLSILASVANPLNNTLVAFASVIVTSFNTQTGWAVPSIDSDAWSAVLSKVIEAQNDGFYVYVSLTNTPNAVSPAFGLAPNKTNAYYFTGKFRYSYNNQAVDPVPDTPFANDIPDSGGEPLVRLNALPFRAYEAIYWSYFSNTQNQQFIVNGQPVFNRWNTTTADGADTTNYHLFRRNYEMDFLTSAMPSPQFGVAPLVGMTALGNITIEDENGISTYHATVDNDGTITKIVATSPTASIEHARTAMNIAQVGMNINDFRATNSFQKFLETTLRKGYRYKDFIMGHHGVDVKQIELDMPVYIGGVSQDVSVNMVSNMSAGQSFSDGQPIPLGEFAGTANCFGQSQNTITHYCDDYGWIIGVLTVVPDPAYSQLLPKHFLHDKQMSYYFNEFAQNGMQPITYREVTPLTAYQDSLVDPSKQLTDTFAYQRPNYDLVGYTDQVHGLFRTDLKDFLIHRIFSHRPELGTEFLEIDPKEVNDIFAYRDVDSDTILGQIIVDIKAKRPVPRVVVPSLGR